MVKINTAGALSSPLTGHVEDGVCLGPFLQEPEGLAGRHDDQFEVAALSLTFDLLHDRQIAVGSGADHQPLALPGNLFFEGEGRMPELVAESLGRRLLAFTDPTAIDDDIVEGAMNEPDRMLRSLDAIHLATARILAPELDALVTYDDRLLKAATDAGLVTVSPGD